MFEVQRTLLNHKFEGYKFNPVEDVVYQHSIPHAPTQTTISGRSPLAFQEVQSRIRHNHLTVRPSGGAVYIDAEYKVIGVTIGDVSCLS